ncbi:MAG: ABC transporter permease [Promethearchaeota archaeon]
MERQLASPLSLTEILLGIILSSTLYSAIITMIITIIFIFINSIVISSFIVVSLIFSGIILMAVLGSLLGLMVAANPTDTTSDVMILINFIKFPLLFISGIFIPLKTMPANLVFLSFLSPVTFLTDLLRFCTDGSNFFLYGFDLLMLFVWIIILFIVNLKLHKKTMPKRFSETNKSMKMKIMKKKS